jgi:hypothetical protein
MSHRHSVTALTSWRVTPTSPRQRRHRDPQAALAWLWKFLDGARRPGSCAAARWSSSPPISIATRLVVPASQRLAATRWSPPRDIAAKALKKLAGPQVPETLIRLDRWSSALTPRTTRPDNGA